MLGVMSDHRTTLARRWEELARHHRWPDAQAGTVGAELLDRYAEPHRHYHGLAHLAAVLSVADELAGGRTPLPVELAVWYHDAVYEGRAGEDEEASACLAEDQLPGLGVDADGVARVAAMVRATASHFDPEADHDAETALLLDADLAVLGAPADVYDRYAAGVRAEHPSVPKEAFRAGRSRVLDALLARPRLFLTAEGRSRFETAARLNLARERARLAASRPADDEG